MKQKIYRGALLVFLFFAVPFSAFAQLPEEFQDLFNSGSLFQNNTTTESGGSSQNVTIPDWLTIPEGKSLPSGVDIQGYLNQYNQIIEGFQTKSGNSLTVQPRIPAPGETVTVSFSNASYDLYQSSFSWYINGVLQETGVGITSITTEAPNAGQYMTVSVVVETNQGQELQKSVEIVTGAVDILWEAQTYTPNLYKGKSLYTPASNVKLVANPDLGFGNPATFSYRWYQNGNLLENLSGRGKRVAVIQGRETTRDMEIKVEVTNPQTGSSAEKEIVIERSAPEIILYSDSPLYGPRYQNAVGNQLSLNTQEVTLVAEPFFFNTKNTKNLTYQWSMNNNPLSISSNRITVRDEGNSGVTSQLSLQAQNQASFFQQAEAETVIRTRQNSSGNNTFSN